MSQHYDHIQINTDGGSRNNPGPAAIGVVAKSDNQEIFTISKKIGINTNNVAEYQAVISALEEYQSQDISSLSLNFILDSELVVKQIVGLYKIKQQHLQLLKNIIDALIKTLKENQKIKDLTFVNVLRAQNKEADKLVNMALDS